MLSIQSEEVYSDAIHDHFLVQEIIKHQYSENFTDISYENATMTNATGWGDKILSIPLKGFGEPVYIDYRYALDVFVENNLTFIDGFSGVFLIINTTNPTNPEVLTQIAVGGNVRAVHARNDFVYVGGGGLTVINISDPLNPGEHFVQTTGNIRDVYIQGDYAFMAMEGKFLYIMNICNLSTVYEFSTRPIISKATTGEPYGIYVLNDFAYLAQQGYGLAIINISDPLNPGEPIDVDLEGNARDVVVKDDYAYVAVGSSGLAIINISDPLNSGEPIYYDTEYFANDVHIDNGIAFVATGDAGYDGSFVAIDVHNPTTLNTIVETNKGGSEGVFVQNGYAYFADMTHGLAIVEIKDIFSFVTPAIAQTTSIYGGTGFIQNINVRANQTIYPNTSISHYISTDENTWTPITLNETLSFSTNDTHDFFWRAVLDTDNSTKSPVIDSILIEYEVYYDETTTTTTETTTTETTTTETTTEPITTEESTTTISPGETKNCDFSNRNEFDFSISTSLSSASTQIELNNLQPGLALQITISPRLGQTFTLFSIRKTQSEIDWQLIDSQGHVKLSVTQSNVETITKSITIDTSGSWRLVFHWENSIQPMIFDCNVKQIINPSNIPDLFFPLTILIILLSAFGFVLYKTITVWSKEWQKRPEKETILITKQQAIVREETKGYKRQPLQKSQPTPEIIPKRERKPSKTPIVTQIEEFSPKTTERRSFFCQLDNAQYPKTDSGYQCENCSRMVCTECYDNSLKVGVPNCPFCDGSLVRIQ